ncbi:MAG: hypothetical protein UFG06_05685 [Lachnospiraceae bacterium]|nr:hypothetical protein [Lachnospiraceae bacterium]
MSRENLKESIDKELSFIKPNVEEGLGKLQKRIEKGEMTKNTTTWNASKILVAVSAALLMVMLPTAVVLAYEYYQSIYQLPRLEGSVVVGEAPLKNDVEVVEEEQSASMENLQITWTGQQLENSRAVMTFTLKTKDGSPLIMDEINKAPVFFPLSFETVQVTVNEVSRQFSGLHESYQWITEDFYVGCTSVTEDFSGAEFELSIGFPKAQLEGEVLNIQFNNLIGTFHKFTDLKTTGTLADILADSPEGENLHVPFAEEYPECYIDSYGFVSDKLFGNPENIWHIVPHGTKMFTMTVVCDEASKDIIRNMVFQNTNTGLNGIAEMQVKELEDGRLRFYYSVNYDASYVNEEEPRDTTFDDLQKLVLKLDGQTITEVVSKGVIEEKIILE